MLSKYILLILFLATSLLLTKTSLGQRDSIKKFKAQVLPSVFLTPETSWGFGGTLLGSYAPQDTNTRKSYIQLFMDVTLMKQISFQSDFNLFTEKNKIYIRGSHDISKFPEFYFGIGNNSEKGTHCLIDIQYLDVKLAAYHHLKNDWYVGPTVHHQNLAHISKNISQEGFFIDHNGYSSTSGGLSLLVDKRNDILNPSKGYYVETKFSKYFDHTGMTSGFWNSTLDARYYHLFNKVVFNSNVYAVHNKGVVPFRLMPGLGGARFLRGYYSGRFRDNNLALAQVEFRRNVFWRIGVAAFTGVGQVYSNVREFNPNRFHYNYGGGLRFQLQKDSPANIRLDYGKTKDSHGFYIVFGECF